MKLEVVKSAFGYKEKDIFEDVSFNVNPGEIFCLLGPNGCGKSTMLECILGINKLKSGEILLDGKGIEGFKSHKLAERIAYVPQIQSKTFPYRVIDVVLMGRTVYTGMFSSPSKEDFEIAEKALDQVGLGKFKDQPYTNLSGGETQLVMIARALAQNTPLIIMDEPTAHLDFRFELIILETIVRLVKESKISVIMATHFPNHAFYFENNNITTRVGLMGDNRLDVIGTPTDELTEGNMEKVFKIKAKIVTQNISGKEIKQIIPLSVY